jgi:hypothetical protein
VKKASPGLRGIEGGRSPEASAISLDPDDAERSFPVSEFTIPAQDSHGHTAKVISRVPPNFKHQISVILSKQPFNQVWDTESDFLRWCIFLGLTRVTEALKDPEVTSLMALIAGHVEAARIEQEHLRFGESLQKISGTVAELMNKGAAPQAKKIILGIKLHIEQIDDPFWRTKYQEELIDRFEFLIGGKKESGGKKARAKKKDRRH